MDASEIQVQVCLYAFDLIFLNGEVSSALRQVATQSGRLEWVWSCLWLPFLILLRHWTAVSCSGSGFLSVGSIGQRSPDLLQWFWGLMQFYISVIEVEVSPSDFRSSGKTSLCSVEQKGLHTVNQPVPLFSLLLSRCVFYNIPCLEMCRCSTLVGYLPGSLKAVSSVCRT